MALTEEEYRYAIQAADKDARGKPFADYGLSKEQRRVFNEYRNFSKERRRELQEKANQGAQTQQEVQSQPKTNLPPVQGPVRPGTDEKTFRETGKSLPQPKPKPTLQYDAPIGPTKPFQGPVQRGMDDVEFRNTGQSKPLTPPSKSSGLPPPFSNGLDSQGVEKMPGVVSAADNSLNNYLQNRGTLLGTLDYGLQKARGKVSRTFEKQQGQNPFAGQTGERLIDVAMVGFFVNPITGPPLAVAGLADELTTGRGRQRNMIAEGLNEKYKVPKALTAAGLIGLSATAGLGSTKAVGRGTEKLLGYPKLDVKFLGKTESIIDSGEKTTIITLTGAKVTRKGFFSDKEAIVAARGATRFTKADDLLSFESGSVGISRELKPLAPPRGKAEFGEPKEFAALGKGFAKETKQSINIPIEGVKGGQATIEIPGTMFFGTIRSYPKGKNPITEDFLTMGKTFDIKDYSVSSSLAAPIKRDSFGKARGIKSGGRIDSFGAIKSPKEDYFDDTLSDGLGINSKDFGSTVIKKDNLLQSKKLIAQENLKTAIATNAFPSPKPINPLPRAIAPLKPESFTIQDPISTSRSEGAFAGTGLYEKTDEVGLMEIAPVKLVPLNFAGMNNNQKNPYRLGKLVLQSPLEDQKSKQRQGAITRELLGTPTAQRPRQRPLQREDLNSLLKPRQLQRLRVDDKLIRGRDLVFPRRVPPIIPPFANIPSFNLLDGGKGKGKVKRKLRRTPSFFAVQTGLTGKPNKALEETGLFERPLERDLFKKKERRRR